MLTSPGYQLVSQCTVQYTRQDDDHMANVAMSSGIDVAKLGALLSPWGDHTCLVFSLCIHFVSHSLITLINQSNGRLICLRAVYFLYQLYTVCFQFTVTCCFRPILAVSARRLVWLRFLWPTSSAASLSPKSLRICGAVWLGATLDDRRPCLFGDKLATMPSPSLRE